MTVTRTCKVFLVGEGTSDIGDYARLPQHRGTPRRRGAKQQPPCKGFVGRLVERLVEDAARLELEGRKMASLPRQPEAEPRHALGRKARQALALAATEGAALVFVTDVDREAGTKRSRLEGKRHHRKLLEDIEEGFVAAIVDDPPLAAVVRVVAAPCRMIEAWAVSDADLFDDAKPLGAPEELWGDEDVPESNHPKNVLRRMLGRDPTPADFEDLADRIGLDVLAERCPLSFGPFREAIHRAVAACVGPTEEAT